MYNIFLSNWQRYHFYLKYYKEKKYKFRENAYSHFAHRE